MKKPTLEDTLMAYRYLYYVKVQPAIRDSEYDALERKFHETNVNDSSPMNKPGSDLESSYTEGQKELAAKFSKR